MSQMLPIQDGLKSIAYYMPSEEENYHLILNSTWVPQLTVTGLEDIPSNLSDASNSIKKSVTIRCSMRLPPTLSAEKAKEMVHKIILGGDP
jgi:hypothetical protein